MSGGLRRVFARHFDAYCRDHRLDAQRLRVAEHIRCCRTPALGGQRLRCERCQEMGSDTIKRAIL